MAATGLFAGAAVCAVGGVVVGIVAAALVSGSRGWDQFALAMMNGVIVGGLGVVGSGLYVAGWKVSRGGRRVERAWTKVGWINPVLIVAGVLFLLFASH